MEMLQLRYFYEVAMAESIAKTAQKHMVPASSVSASIKRLEQELGVELFARTSNRLAITEKGREFLISVSNILSQLDASVNALSSPSTGKQEISILARATRTTLIRWLVRFHRMCPSVTFKLEFEDSPENYGNYDIIISEPDETLETYSYFIWRRFDIRVEALETDPLCGGPITLNQLRDRIFVTTKHHPTGFRIFSQACQEQGFTPKVFLECDDNCCRDIALQSGACLNVNYGVGEESAPRSLRYLQISDFQEQVTINVYYKKEAYEGNLKMLLELLQTSGLRP